MNKHQKHIDIKQFFKKSVACLLAILVLTSSAGVPLYKQTCLMMGGTEKLALFQAPHCCPTQKDSPPQHHQKAKESLLTQLKPMKCCNLSVDFIKAELQSGTIDQSNLKWNSLAVLVPNTFKYVQQPFAPFIPAKYFYTDTSPPLSGRQLVIQKQSFLL